MRGDQFENHEPSSSLQTGHRQDRDAEKASKMRDRGLRAEMLPCNQWATPRTSLQTAQNFLVIPLRVRSEFDFQPL